MQSTGTERKHKHWQQHIRLLCYVWIYAGQVSLFWKWIYTYRLGVDFSMGPFWVGSNILDLWRLLDQSHNFSNFTHTIVALASLRYYVSAATLTLCLGWLHFGSGYVLRLCRFQIGFLLDRLGSGPTFLDPWRPLHQSQDQFYIFSSSLRGVCMYLNLYFHFSCNPTSISNYVSTDALISFTAFLKWRFIGRLHLNWNFSTFQHCQLSIPIDTTV